MQVVAPAVTGSHGVGGKASGRVGETRHGLVEETHLVKPPNDVPAAEAARDPGRLAAGQDYLAAGHAQLLADLRAGLATTDHEHSPGGQGPFVPVGVNVHTRQADRQAVGYRRPVGPLEGTGS